jgi:hypothetical protein
MMSSIQGFNVEMEIPNIGVFYIRNKVAGVKFNDYLINDTRVRMFVIMKGISRKTINEKKQRGEMLLTRDALGRLSNSRY